MEFRILGPLEVRSEQGLLPLGRAKPRAVLAVLLLHANEPVSVERLALALWGEEAPAGATKTVQVHVSRLRKALGGGDIVETTAAGYRLRVRPGELDAERFERLVEDGRRALADGEAEQAAGVLREALSLWRGPPLAELAFEPFAQAEIARLEEQRLAALEARVDADLAAGWHAPLVGELQKLVTGYPTRERLVGQLMVALYRCGRQAEALEVYRGARQGLVERLGIELGSELQELEFRMLNHDPALDLTRAVASEAAAVGANVDGASGSKAPLLLEREAELVRLRAGLESARAGEGRVVLIEASGGMGKSALLATVRESARRSGFRVVSARGSESEIAMPYGVVRQLLERTMVGAGSADRRELLAGAAGLAAPVLGLDPAADMGARGAAGAADRSFAARHGLYWLCANLAQRDPLLVAIDDLHWCDLPSLTFLGYLARRLDELHLLIVVATRPSADPPAGELIAQLAAEPVGETITLGALSSTAVGSILEAGFNRVPDASFTATCHEVTGGTPFSVGELVLAMREVGLDPVDGEAARVRELGPRSLARTFRARVGRLGPAAVRLAEATAVLGDDAELRLAASVADLDHDLAVAAADALAGAGVLLDARPLAFAHPIIRTAIERALRVGERARLHERAACRFALDANDDTRAATHLLSVEPADRAWPVDVLLAAAEDAIFRGAPNSAVAFLRRALAEPPAPGVRYRVLRDLGFAEFHDADDQAAVHLAQALAEANDSDELVDITKSLGPMLQLAGEQPLAVGVYDSTLQRIRGRDADVELTIESWLLCAALVDRSTAALARERLPAFRRRVAAAAAGSAAASVLAPLALAAAGANEPVARVAALGREVLRDNARPLPESADRPVIFYIGCVVLVYAERYAEAQALLDASVADAQRLGSVPHFVGMSQLRAWLAQRCGALADAEADARLALAPDLPSFFRVQALCVVIEVLAERGEFAEAEGELINAGCATGAGPALGDAMLSWYRGRLRLAAGRAADALVDFEAAGEHLADLGFISPTICGWRGDAALAHQVLGDTAAASRLAEEELRLARDFGGPRALGCALRAAAMISDGNRAVTLLRQAVSHLAASRAVLEHGRATVDLGTAMLERGDRDEARQLLGRGLDLAERCHATRLASRARSTLVSAGFRPPRAAPSQLYTISAGDRRVAGMAASGLTTREIAQAHFDTSRSIERQIARVLRDLNLNGPAELADALRDAATDGE